MLFSSQGRYLSRNLHQVIKDIIGRAIQVVDATGIDPDRYYHIYIFKRKKKEGLSIIQGRIKIYF